MTQQIYKPVCQIIDNTCPDCGGKVESRGYGSNSFNGDPNGMVGDWYKCTKCAIGLCKIDREFERKFCPTC